MSAPFGIDLGSNNSVIAAAFKNNIDVVVGEIGNRSTATLVGFNAKARSLGENAKIQQTSNVKNTVGNLNRIIGLSADSPDFEIEKKYFTAPLVAKDSEVAAKVRLAGEQKEFSATQLSAMFINNLKEVAQNTVKGKITDVVIAVPAWYSEKQRQAVADASRIAGLNPVRIVNEVTAAAVGYGVFKNNFPDEPKKIAFVDIGYSTYTVSIAAIKKGELKILGTATDKHFGGRDFDYAITEHFAKEFKSKYKIDIHTNPKAFHRVLTAAEKVKKVLSANTSAPINIESVMDDVDVSSTMERSELEEYVQPLLDRLHVPVEAALKAAGLTTEDLDNVEVIGGCTRVPSIKARLVEIFGKPLSSTLNSDEAIARGAAFICAIHSPTLRVRPFKFEDYNPFSVSYFWDKDEEDVDHMEVFPVGSTYPSTKIITLYRSKDFEISAKYTHPEALPKGTDPLIAKWKVTGVKVPEGEDSVAVKLKLRMDPSGFYTVEAAYTVVEKIVQELVENPEAKEDDEPEYKDVKKLVKQDDLVLEAQTLSLPEALRNQYFEEEFKMVANDKLVSETEERKNALEEYIYELRGKLDDIYAPFASEQEKTKLQGLLTKTEDWLYDEGDDTTKAKYIAKYEELARTGNLIRGRYLAKQEEEKQAKRAKQESKFAQEMAAKIAADRAAKEAEAPKKDDDVVMTEELD
ncbi:adenyl-nucleotide exchange factor [Saccharomycopsis crataegensis]|uniref:Adenyl-nucleotide exchange factor n=1 Tax=Saccharomycopsis crataegensis TaxID=43959 RepID=A0AAV5QQF8_9ASCO|nr:adenyl-nucleotide exchange factor [Saccharomycopsis crataegensis]